MRGPRAACNPPLDAPTATSGAPASGASREPADSTERCARLALLSRGYWRTCGPVQAVASAGNRIDLRPNMGSEIGDFGPPSGQHSFTTVWLSTHRCRHNDRDNGSHCDTFKCNHYDNHCCRLNCSHSDTLNGNACCTPRDAFGAAGGESPVRIQVGMPAAFRSLMRSRAVTRPCTGDDRVASAGRGRRRAGFRASRGSESVTQPAAMVPSSRPGSVHRPGRKPSRLASGLRGDSGLLSRRDTYSVTGTDNGQLPCTCAGVLGGRLRLGLKPDSGVHCDRHCCRHGGTDCAVFRATVAAAKVHS